MSNALFENIYNPDVLSCLANLSNDEVFTPPDVVNKMLDMLPQELFRNPDTTFLDPACKTGVFLREIAKRLIVGLEPQIPDLQERVDHIFQKQLYGIAITELTSLLSRRGVYCSKYPNSEFSVSRFDDAQGNIRYKRIPHTWGKTTYDSNGKPKASCIWCGASKSEYDRSSELETHAYEWIHTQNPEELFKMKFDVIIGNPPYQLSDGGNGASAIPIYNKFIVQSMKLSPRYLSMIIPSRWMTGGRGLDEFRNKMIHDRRFSILHDYSNASDCFHGVEIKGGVCYFLWERDYNGQCDVYHYENDTVEHSMRYLVEDDDDIFIRRKILIDIKNQVWAVSTVSFDSIVSSMKPYGFRGDIFKFPQKYKFPEMSMSPIVGGYRLIGLDGSKRTYRYLPKNYPIPKRELLNDYKVFITRNWGTGELSDIPSSPVLASPGDLCTETFLQIGPFNNQSEQKNALSYIQTKFFRAMIAIRKQDQGASRAVYHYVPLQDFSKPWTDAELYAKYNLTQEEIDFIESMIKPMDSTNIKED